MTQNRSSKADRQESGLVQRMRNSVRELPMTNPHVLLACSGGKDSVALAAVLADLRRLGLLTFSIAHIHHGQHDRADLAVEAVRKIGRRLDVNVQIHLLDQNAIGAHGGVGLEEAMRRERYSALARMSFEEGADCIALAHHQSDQAETILLHLMRGAGVDGLAGMNEWEIRKIPWWQQSRPDVTVGLWRPLIRESAGHVAEVAASSGLPVVEDPTNVDTAWRRNAIRHRVLPMLEEIAEGSTSAIARSASVIASDAELLEHITRQALQDCRDGDALVRTKLVALSHPLQLRVVRAWVMDLLPNHELSHDRVLTIELLAERNRGGAVAEIGAGRSVTLGNGLLTLD